MNLSRSELERLAETDILDAIPADALQAALASPPFVEAGELLNVRDLGIVPGSGIKPAYIYRSALLRSDADSAAWLVSKVTRIFDLRTSHELKTKPEPSVDGVETHWVEPEGVHPKVQLEAFVDGDGSDGWKAQYLTILNNYRPAYRAVLEHVRDRPDDPFLFHCTAGRDRTGLLSGLILHLAGTDEETIVFDYMLTRIGIEPARQAVEARLRDVWGVSDRKGPGYHNMTSLRPSFWYALAEGVRDTYGGWDGYVTQHLGFSADELAEIKANLHG